jgi:hypothetical protein
MVQQANVYTSFGSYTSQATGMKLVGQMKILTDNVI